jgi:Gpi18-like mannosyltransferase
MPALAILLLGALALRFIIAYVLFPRSGFETDIGAFSSWSNTLVDHGPGGFYASAGFADYLPGYLYVLWLVGLLGHGLATIFQADPSAVTGGLLKLPAMAADIAIGWLLFRLVRRWIGERPGAERMALIVAALYLFNPVTWYDSALWGQVDSVGTLVALAGLALLIEGHSEGASAVIVLAALVKPQYGVVLLPILGAVLLRRHLLRPGSGPQMAGGPAWLRRWAAQEVGVWRLLSSAAAAALVLFIVITPFDLDVFKLAKLIGTAGATYPWLSVNAYNPWALVGSGGGQGFAFAGLGRWASDTVPLLGSLPGVIVGTFLLAAAFLLGIGQLLRRADRRSILLAAAYLSLAFFLLPTRVHERYLFPIFVFLPLLGVFERRMLAVTVLAALSAFLNLHGVLTTPIWGTPNVDDLVLGDVARDPLVIVLCVAIVTGIFGLLAWRSASVLAGRRNVFRGGTAALMALGGGLEEVGRPERLPTPARVEPPPPVQGPPIPPRPHGPLRRALDARLAIRSLRRDRSAALVGEPHGRLDRLDLLLVLLVVVAALVLRTWRVGEPRDMYFDEVYHARTATEFLQDWRYGQPHGIYEYTHPHLAKYLIAAGIVAFGRNEVSATAELGFAARAAVIEVGWTPLGASAPRGGDRLYVSGPGGVRVYDLASRALVATITLPNGAQPGALAVDSLTHRLLVTDLAGVLWDLGTTALDGLRAGDIDVLPGVERLGDLGTAAVTMLVDQGGSDPAGPAIVAVLEGGQVVVLDAQSGSRRAETTVPGAADAVTVSGQERLVVDASSAPDTEAADLASMLDMDVATIRRLLAGASGDVVVSSSLTTDQRSTVQAAIEAGTLTATRLETGRLVAVAATEGLVLLDAASLGRVQAFPMSAPATGVTFVEGVSTPTLYVASGVGLERIEVPDKDPPVVQERVWMPGPIRDVLFDPVTKLVHAMGTAPDGLAETVYVVEPHGNAVFADARLPATPVAWALDAQPDQPSVDREQLLTVAADGSLAVVEVGHNAFGWRFPGVIAGALLAGLLYLLGRLLVRRRDVALLVAGLVLLDGMGFAQSRIAMNDTYVGLFIVAAYAVFGALWLGAWRGWSSVLIGLPLVGLLLGLALAAKWVGLYAIGGVVLLVLLRSALGRILALLAMIGLSGVLGWLAFSAPTSGSPGPVGTTVATALVVIATFALLRRLRVSAALLLAGTLVAAVAAVLLLVRGDALFLVLMVGLTLLLAVAIVLRPVTLTLAELRFGILAPGVAGSAVGLGAIVFRSALPADGLLSGPVLLVVGMVVVAGAIVAYGVIALLGRAGLGPLAALPPPEALESRLPAAAPAPEGWLLPGWRWGMPWLWALLCFTALPLAVYVASYIPWVDLGNRWTETFPAGHTGQTFLALQTSMYVYHNDLRVTHAASSPWWAWPFDLKPVWFYLGTFGGRTGLIYDAGNLVLFWLSVPAMAWAAWMAWRRRSLALTLVVVAFLCQWLPWSRVDRATFQYHYYTSVPFIFLALAYFLAELWHGPSRRTWLFARLAVAATIVATPLLWLLRDPLCALSGVGRVNPNSQACGFVRETFVLSDRAALAFVVLAVGLGAIAWWSRRPARGDGGLRGRTDGGGGEIVAPARPAWLIGASAGTVVALALVLNLVPETPLIAAPVGLIALYVVAAAMLLPLAYAAWLALGVADPRRLVVGVLGAAGLWFVLFYPDIGALPLPTGLSRLFQVLPLPTYNYDFQFAVNTAAAVSGTALGLESFSLAAMVAFLAVAAMYATWTWRLAVVAEAAARGGETGGVGDASTPMGGTGGATA